MRLQYSLETKTVLEETNSNLLANADGSMIDRRTFDASHLKQELLKMSDFTIVSTGGKSIAKSSQKLKLNIESEREKRTVTDGLNSCGCSSRESCSPEFAESKIRPDVHYCDECKPLGISNRVVIPRYRPASEDLDSTVYTNLSLRTLRDIRNSLEGKVKRLREEKEETSAKIEQAQIEDNVRRMEKQKLRQQLNLHRRDRLKKMIHELHKKLENQSIRLQFCYTAILGVQRSVLKTNEDKRRGPVVSLCTDFKEAPF